MKKGIAVALLLCLVLSVFSIASAATVKLAVKGGSICLRKGPGLNYSVITYLKDGQQITVLSKGSSWSKVRNAKGQEGYIKSLYISGIGKAYADGTTYYANKYKAVVKTSSTGSTAYMRGGASSSAGVLDTLKNGTQVTVLGENGSWKLVSTSSGNQGFISASLLANPKASQKATVNCSGLYMRSGPSSSYESIALLRRGTQVSIISTANKSWWLVQYGNHTGYMYSKYLSK